MFLRRDYTPEIMDNTAIRDERLSRALDELDTINAFLGGYSASSRGFKEIFGLIPKEKTISVLDIGAGSSGTFNVGTMQHRDYRITSLDINPGACKYIIERRPDYNVVCADALSIPFKPQSFDIVHSSLFLHHFREEDIVRMFRCFNDISRYGIVINDLHRSFLAMKSIKLLTRLFSRSEMVRNDGPLSVRRAFRKNELKGMLRRSGFASFLIKWRWAFRWLVVIRKPEHLKI